jgi:hypothetical protein
MRRSKISDKGVGSRLWEVKGGQLFVQTIQGYSWPCSKLRDTCYNSRLPFRTDYLALWLKVTSSGRKASSLTRGRSLHFFLQMHSWFSKLSGYLYIDAGGGWSVRNRFLKALWTLVHEFVFEYSIRQKLFYMRNVHGFWKLRNLEIKIGNMEIQPPLLKSLRIWLSPDTGYMWVCFAVSSHFIPKIVSIAYGHPVFLGVTNQIRTKSWRIWDAVFNDVVLVG